MTTPTTVELPHSLGREEVRRRLRARIGELASHIPGGFAEVRSSWPSEDRLALDIAAMGQSVSATIDIEERLVRVTFVLPALLGFFSGAVAGAIRDQGGRFLLPDRRD